MLHNSRGHEVPDATIFLFTRTWLGCREAKSARREEIVSSQLVTAAAVPPLGLGLVELIPWLLLLNLDLATSWARRQVLLRTVAVTCMRVRTLCERWCSVC